MVYYISRYTIDAFDAIKGVLQFQDIPLTHLMHCDVTFNVLLNHVIHPQLKSEVRKFTPVLLNIFGISDTRQRTSDCGRFFFREYVKTNFEEYICTSIFFY